MIDIIQLAKDTLKGGTKTSVYPETIDSAVKTTDVNGVETTLDNILIKGIKIGDTTYTSENGKITLPESESGEGFVTLTIDFAADSNATPIEFSVDNAELEIASALINAHDDYGKVVSDVQSFTKAALYDKPILATFKNIKYGTSYSDLSIMLEKVSHNLNKIKRIDVEELDFSIPIYRGISFTYKDRVASNFPQLVCFDVYFGGNLYETKPTPSEPDKKDVLDIDDLNYITGILRDFESYVEANKDSDEDCQGKSEEEIREILFNKRALQFKELFENNKAKIYIAYTRIDIGALIDTLTTT